MTKKAATKKAATKASAMPAPKPAGKAKAWVALLRGINVGGNKMLSMEGLRDLCLSIGYTDVRTWLQSGNVVFRAAGTASAVAQKLAAAIRERHDMDVRVVVRDAEGLATAIAANPLLPGPERRPAALVVVFLDAEPSAAARAALPKLQTGSEEVVLGARELFVHYGEGMARSKLTLTLIERVLGVTGTARNWNTTLKLRELVDDLR